MTVEVQPQPDGAADGPSALPSIDTLQRQSVTDHVFEALYDRVIDLTLPPGTRLSEAEVATRMGVSRQPVRDAFFRLSELGFIRIRPQRSTTVTRISPAAVLQAAFVRTAIEIACLHKAAVSLTRDDLEALDRLVEDQQRALDAGDRLLFHRLDDSMHREICERAGLGFAWTLIRENKGHMDRVRLLSLAFGSPAAMEDHRDLLAALHARDGAAAEAVIRPHLGRIGAVIDRLRLDSPEIFEPDE